MAKIGHVNATLELTPTEHALYKLLESGEHRTSEELLVVIDAQADKNTLRCHMSRVRTKLKQSGASGTVICEDGGYRLAAYVVKS